MAERGEVNRNAGFDFPLLSDVDGTACEAYGVPRNLAAAPVERRTVVIGADRVVQDVVRSELRMGKHVEGALRALSVPGG